MTLSRCPLCGGQFPDSSCVDYDYAFRKNLEHIATAESDRAREFSYLANIVYEIRDRLFGISIGSVQEKMSVLYLKQACPLDHFSEEMASKHGTDIVASVMEGETCVGKISISVKKQKKWSPDFPILEFPYILCSVMESVCSLPMIFSILEFSNILVSIREN